MICRTIPLNETAHLDTYILNNSNEYNVGKKRPFVLVLPGGAYAFTSDREAEPVALRFNSIGCHAGVLWYTTRDLVPNVPRNAFEEAMMAVKWVREHAEEYLIHTDQIIVCGFSAGGHLAIECATMWHESWIAEKLHCSSDMLKINLAIPCYAAGKAEKMPVGENGPMMLHARQSGNMRFSEAMILPMNRWKRTTACAGSADIPRQCSYGTRMRISSLTSRTPSSWHGT